MDQLKMVPFRPQGPKPQPYILVTEVPMGRTVRLKRAHAKTRTGCAVCRQRKIKCDEERPSCRRCTKSGRQCPGYSLADGQQVPRNVNIIHNEYSDLDSRRMFQFFIEDGVPVLGAYFGRPFWGVVLPQASFLSQPVKHALIAAGAVIERVEYDSDSILVQQHHFHKALVESSQSDDVRVVLMTCLLFAACDFMEGSLNDAYRHVEYGIKIITEQQHDPAVLEFAPLFMSFAAKAPTYGYAFEVPEDFPQIPWFDVPYVPSTFRTLNQAAHALSGVAHYLFQNGSNTLKLLNDWRWAFLKSSPGWKDTELVLCHELTLRAMLEYLNHEELFASCCRMAKLKPNRWSLGFIPPLFFLATKSDFKLRRKAIALLRRLRINERSWTSCIAAAVAEKTLNLEEQIESSIKIQQVVLVGSSTGRLTYSTGSLMVESSFDIGQCKCTKLRSTLDSIMDHCGYQGAVQSTPTNCGRVGD